MINYHLDVLKATRKNIFKSVEHLSNEQLNIIPDGFNNNLIWNLGHVIVTHQLLCYNLAGEMPHVSNEMISAYRKGTRPDGIVSDAGIKEIKELAFSTLDLFQKDIDNKLFKNYKDYPTSYGITLTTFEDAAIFNNVHEAMHLGNILSIRKLV